LTRRISDVICVIDDDASLRRSLRNLLRSEGFHAETFESAEAFLASGDHTHAVCLLLDLRMPGMGGPELLRHLAASHSPTPVVVMTAHGGSAARQRCLANGAVAFLEKPFEATELLDAIRTAGSTLAPRAHAPVARTPRLGSTVHEEKTHMGISNRPVRLAGSTLGRESHVCAFFNGMDEAHTVLRSFVKEGIDAGEKSVHLVDPGTRDDHIKRFGDAGIDVQGTMETGQLEVRSWAETYLRADRFEQDGMLHLIEEVLQSNTRAGYALTRLVAQMEWALLDKPGVDGLVEYETRLNYVLPKYHACVICTYDLTKFSASVVMDVMRTHPMVIIGGVLQENPFFVPPEQFLLELRERRSVRTSAGMTS
jgi:CheY-like chemotaxis protein